MSESDIPCDECGACFKAGSSRMARLCPECSHHLYGHPPCLHVFDRAGRCVRCGWAGERSPFVAGLIAKNKTTEQ